MAEIKDWELNDDYFQAEDSAKELKLEDFMTEEPSEHDGSDGTFGSFGDTTDQDLLQKTIHDVHEVLARAQKGDTIKEIAAELFLSEGTVRNYLSSILDKLQLRDRTQVAVFYYQHK